MGLDLSSATAAILTPDVPDTPIPTGVSGPLPEGIVGLMLGRSSLSLQGISVVPGVVDSDYTGEIKVLISLPTKTVQINKGQRITQLLLLPYYQTGETLTSQARGPRGFGSSDLAFCVQEITASRPLKDVLIQGNKMSGLLDTGADVSCIAGLQPLEESILVFTDDSSNGKADTIIDKTSHVQVTEKTSSERAELRTVIWALQHLEDHTFNLLTDS